MVIKEYKKHINPSMSPPAPLIISDIHIPFWRGLKTYICASNPLSKLTTLPDGYTLGEFAKKNAVVFLEGMGVLL